MHFDRPDQPLTFEASIAQEAKRMRARREKASQRRKARHAGFWDDETIEAPQPPGPRVCSVEGCDRRHKARGLCETHYKRRRRRSGKAN